MSDFTVSRLGQINSAGDATALFLKIFAGEVLTAFETKNVMLDKHTVRTIQHGKSASVPVVGNIGACRHTPGTEITGQSVNANERIIPIDDMLISDVFIANVDEAMNHYDVRSIYTTNMGRKLANEFDLSVQKELVKAARSGATVTGGDGGSQIVNDLFKNDGGTAGSATEAAKAVALAEGIFQAMQVLDEKDAPDERFCNLSPAEYYCLVQNKDVLNRDWGGSGSYSEGNVFRIAGCAIVPTNQVPHADTTGTDTYHGVDSSKTVGLIYTPDALGTVKLLDLGLDKEYSARHQGTLMVAKYLMGHGVLRPECSVELMLNTLTYA